MFAPVGKPVGAFVFWESVQDCVFATGPHWFHMKPFLACLFLVACGGQTSTESIGVVELPDAAPWCPAWCERSVMCPPCLGPDIERVRAVCEPCGWAIPERAADVALCGNQCR